MIVVIPDVLSAEQVVAYRQALARAEWQDGRATAGHVAAQAKHNEQLPLDSTIARELGEALLQTLARQPRFIAATLPARILPPRFNRYHGGGTYGDHIDNAIFAVPGSAQRLRSDVSITLFLSDPASYEGGELVIEDTYGTQSLKLPAGHLVIYPSSSVHRVNPVPVGVRLAAFFWVQSLIREDHRRRLLWDLDQSIQTLSAAPANADSVARLSGVYHNLIREWGTP